jgi:hypothetical protein
VVTVSTSIFSFHFFGAGRVIWHWQYRPWTAAAAAEPQRRRNSVDVLTARVFRSNWKRRTCHTDSTTTDCSAHLNKRHGLFALSFRQGPKQNSVATPPLNLEMDKESEFLLSATSLSHTHSRGRWCWHPLLFIEKKAWLTFFSAIHYDRACMITF